MTDFNRIHRLSLASLATTLILLGLTACEPIDPVSESRAASDGSAIRVTGEIQSANSINYGPPSIRKIWQYTIAYMAPDGSIVPEGQDVLRFNTQELQTNILNKSNRLNEKQKELQKQQIVARERLA